VSTDTVSPSSIQKFSLRSPPRICESSEKPLLAFAVCYVAAHLALGLVDEEQAEAILNHCEGVLEG
jgi:hypothetical protein